MGGVIADVGCEVERINVVTPQGVPAISTLLLRRNLPLWVMSYFDPMTWRAFTAREMRAHLDKIKAQSSKKSRAKKGRRKSSLVLQETISPFDTYTYLHARFGEPNGFQTFLAKDDSDNLFHWDYNLYAGGKELLFVGATEEVHVWFDGTLSDTDCSHFIANLKTDFGRVGADKGRFASTLEKWSIFPNQYLAIANRCAEIYDSIEDALHHIKNDVLADRLATQSLTTAKKRKAHSSLMSAITAGSTELSILTPVMFESFLGLLVAGLIKPDVKNNAEAFNAFTRSPLNQKLKDLSEKCRGFERPIEQENPVFGRFWSVVNRRNDIIHGNVDPVTDALEVVYFHGKRPLFRTGGDRIRQHWQRLIARYQPRQVIDDYLVTHEFIIEILNHLHPKVRESLSLVMDDTQPGWDNRRKIYGHLFPEHVATTTFEGMRYDWQLNTD